MFHFNYLKTFRLLVLAYAFLPVLSVSLKNGNVLNQFYIKNILKDGAHETMIKINGIVAKEIAVGPKEGANRGIVVRQLSNGKQLVTLIYNGIPTSLEKFEGAKTTSFDQEFPILPPDEDNLLLRECKVDKSADDVTSFIETFEADAVESGNVANGLSNSTSHIAKSEVVSIQRSLENLPQKMVHMTRFSHFKYKCFELRRRVRREVKERRKSNIHDDTLKRSRRSATSIFSMPHTKWCGSGYQAKKFSDLGGLHGADVCCRQHDHCPYFIEAFTSKYGRFNFGLTTISHCSCDRRFKACLKHTGTGASDIVGNVFFNLVKAKCFVFERKRVCRKGNYWRCYKYGFEKQAVIKEPRPFKW